MNLVLLKNISIVGIHWGAYISKEPKLVDKVWTDLLWCAHCTVPERAVAHASAG
jgi:hypothetical protein